MASGVSEPCRFVPSREASASTAMTRRASDPDGSRVRFAPAAPARERNAAGCTALHYAAEKGFGAVCNKIVARDEFDAGEDADEPGAKRTKTDAPTDEPAADVEMGDDA